MALKPKIPVVLHRNPQEKSTCLGSFYRLGWASAGDAWLLLQQGVNHPSVLQEDESSPVPPLRKQSTTKSTCTGISAFVHSFVFLCVCLLFSSFFFLRYVLRVKLTYSSIWRWRLVGLRSCPRLSTCLWWIACLNPPLAGLFENTHSPSPIYKSAKLVFYYLINIKSVAGKVRFELLPVCPLFWSSVDKQRKQDSDSGVSSDNGDKRLSATEVSVFSLTHGWIISQPFIFLSFFLEFAAIRWRQSQHAKDSHHWGGWNEKNRCLLPTCLTLLSI